MYGTLLWATDGGPEADRALEEAVALLSPGGRLVAYHCDQRFVGSRIGGLPLLADEQDRRLHIERQVEQLRKRGIDAELRIESSTTSSPSEIAEAAQATGADAIVCGTRALHRVNGFLATSVAGQLLRRAAMPVVVVPPVPSEEP